jgi:hypothetical protein
MSFLNGRFSTDLNKIEMVWLDGRFSFTHTIMAFTIKVFPKCDILIHKNDISRLGYEKDTKTLSEMIELAILHKCPIIIERARGKWYLKGNGKTHAELVLLIQKNLNDPSKVKDYNSRTVYLLNAEYF